MEKILSYVADVAGIVEYRQMSYIVYGKWIFSLQISLFIAWQMVCIKLFFCFNITLFD